MGIIWKSILQHKEDNTCFLCGSTWDLQKHHVWHGTSNRAKAEKDGLYLRLCSTCHSNLHDKGIKDRYLMEVGERAYLSRYNKTIEEFIERYGKNVI